MVKDFLIAIGNYKKYGELLKRRWYKVTIYVVLLLLLCSIVGIAIPTAVIGSRTLQVLWEDIPEFTITHRGMEIDNEFNLELSGVKVLATDRREVSAEEFGNNITGVLMDSDSVILRNFDRTAEFSYNEFGEDFSVTKADLRQLRPFMYLFAVILFAMLYAAYGISFVLNGLFVGAVASVAAIFMRIRLPIGKYIALGMYSQTLPYILSAAMTLFGLHLMQAFMYIISITLIILFFRTVRMEAIPEQIEINPLSDNENPIGD